MSTVSQNCIVSESRECKFLNGQIDPELVFIAGSSHPEFNQDIEIIRTVLEQNSLRGYFATFEEGEIGQDAFCTKICSKIIQSRFCIVVLNNPEIIVDPIPYIDPIIRPIFDKLDLNLQQYQKMRDVLRTGRWGITLRNFNPNIYLEYGMMAAFGKRRIPIIQRGHKLPFNIQGIDTLFYKPNELSDSISRHIIKMKNETEGITSFGLERISYFDKEVERLVKGKEGEPNPIIEILVGPVNPSKELLPINNETKKLVGCGPDILWWKASSIARGNYFEFQSDKEPPFQFRVDKMGLFYYRDNIKEAKQSVILAHLIFNIFELLAFNVRVLKLKESTDLCKILVRMSGISEERVFFQKKSDFRRVEYNFGVDQDKIEIIREFNPREAWTSIFELGCSIYQEICKYIGALDLAESEKYLKRNVKEALRHSSVLIKRYPDVNMTNISSEELFGKE